MRTSILAITGILAFGSMAYAGPPVTTVSVECNWGKLTMEVATEDGAYLGDHSADPSGDGVGPDDVDHERVGLANVVDPGNLQATCEFIASLP